ncbi:MAG: zinc carboxypeptidase, partial [Proteobacteria bacterium]
MLRKTFFAFLALISSATAFGHGTPSEPGMHWAAIRAVDKEARTKLVNQGFSIENIVEDMSYGYATPELIASFKKQGVEVTANFSANEMRINDFPSDDSNFHNYAEMNAELDKLATDYPTLVHKFTIGKSVEGRDIVGVRINPNARDGLSVSGLPGSIFMGGHHAREHLSMEMPLMLAQHLATNYGKDPMITKLLDSRDVFLIPQINPDGAEFDISTSRYKSWRKNRKLTGQRCDGVDLNRNYGYHWGEGGSSKDSCSDVYMGASAFSEPETQAVKAFIEGHPNLKT